MIYPDYSYPDGPIIYSPFPALSPELRAFYDRMTGRIRTGVTYQGDDPVAFDYTWEGGDTIGISGDLMREALPGVLQFAGEPGPGLVEQLITFGPFHLRVIEWSVELDCALCVREEQPCDP